MEPRESSNHLETALKSTRAGRKFNNVQLEVSMKCN